MVFALKTHSFPEVSLMTLADMTIFFWITMNAASLPYLLMLSVHEVTVVNCPWAKKATMQFKWDRMIVLMPFALRNLFTQSNRTS